MPHSVVVITLSLSLSYFFFFFLLLLLLLLSSYYYYYQTTTKPISQDLGLKMIGKGFLQKVSKKQFRTVYYNANACA